MKCIIYFLFCSVYSNFTWCDFLNWKCKERLGWEEALIARVAADAHSSAYLCKSSTLHPSSHKSNIMLIPSASCCKHTRHLKHLDLFQCYTFTWNNRTNGLMFPLPPFLKYPVLILSFVNYKISLYYINSNAICKMECYKNAQKENSSYIFIYKIKIMTKSITIKRR